MRNVARIAVAIGALGAPAAAAAQEVAFVHVNVVGMRDSAVEADRTVLVRDGRIEAIGASDSVDVPASATRVDGLGGFLLPGLFDMHTHLNREEDLPLYVAHGVTGVQSLNADSWTLQLRDSVEAGRFGPTLYPCSGAVTDVADSAAAERVVAQALARGFDCIKPYDRLTAEGYRVLHDAARREGLLTVGHIPRERTWEDMLAVRPSAVAHAEEFLYSPITSGAAVDSIVRGMREGGIALVTTIANYDRISRQILELPELFQRPELAYFSPVHARAWGPAFNRYRDVPLSRLPDFRRRLRFQRALVRRLAGEGGTVLAGTDVGNTFMVPGWSLHDELQALVESGLSPYRALRTATVDAAAFLGRADELGTVEVGRRADLVLVYGDPLADIANATLIGGVMTRGRWYDRDDLRARLEATRSGFELERAYLARSDSGGVGSALAWLEAQVRSGRPAPGVAGLNEHAYQLWRIEDREEDALRVFEANARLHPGHWIALASLAEMRLARGDEAAARTLLRRAVEANPRNPELREQLDRIP